MTRSYTIEDDIPVPSNGYGKGRKIFPFRDMKVGQSFFVPGHEVKVYGTSNINSVRAAATTHQRYHARQGRFVQFTVRKVTGGLRCWRIR